MSKNEFRSRVYTEKPPYADYDAPRKFEAIKGIIASKLMMYPKAVCSYSGGGDSDILLHDEYKKKRQQEEKIAKAMSKVKNQVSMFDLIGV